MESLNEPAYRAALKALAPLAEENILEIGFGMGETTAEIAQQHPECDYLGVEVHTPGVGSLLARVEKLGLANVRIVQHDAVEVLQHMVAPGALDGVHVFFPDPWPKKRHQKRRLLSSDSVAQLARVLATGGELRFATDSGDYACEALRTILTNGAFAWRACIRAKAQKTCVKTRASTTMRRSKRR